MLNANQQKASKSIPAFLIKEQVIKATRNFFDEQNFNEIIIPVLHKALSLEPTLYAFSTNWQTLTKNQTFYLPLSPEAVLKKALAAGIKNCFGIGHTFRNLENSSNLHHPEFLMLEWYRTDANYQQIMQDLKNLILFVKQDIDNFLNRKPSKQLIYQDQTFDLDSEWEVFSLEKLFKKYAQIEISANLSLPALRKAVQKKDYEIKNATWEQLFNQVFVNEIEPYLPQQPFFLIDFPAQISPLCKPNKQKPYLANRFEFYLAGIELANGNDEQTDAALVKEKFLAEKKYRIKEHLICPPIDQEFLQSLAILEKTQKNYAGIGLGLERLIMIIANVVSLEKLNLSLIPQQA